jgi:hypothetical protein
MPASLMDDTVFTSDIPDISDVSLGEDVDIDAFVKSRILRENDGSEQQVSAFNSSL